VVINRYDFLYRQASLHFQTAPESQKPLYLSKMVDVTDKLVTLLGLVTLKEKLDADKKEVSDINELAKNKLLMDTISKL